ncbi:MAG: hypothetical protein J6C23_00115 [Clostridia bacterium]|nr:hypothetical protein [Clostridia bacterium]
MKEYSELKKRAMLAKQRLKMGYWQNLLRERDDLIMLNGNTAQAIAVADEVRRQKFNRDNLISLNSVQAKEEEELYLKVCKMLDEDDDPQNPIGRLIDSEAYDNMDAMAKQKYVLYLSKKYCEMKERYRLEKIKTC